MKKILFALLLFFGLALTAEAQEPKKEVEVHQFTGIVTMVHDSTASLSPINLNRVYHAQTVLRSDDLELGKEYDFLILVDPGKKPYENVYFGKLVDFRPSKRHRSLARRKVLDSLNVKPITF